MARVFVAMSGGVDSSVAAALLVEEGHDVTGVTMQLLPPGDDEGGCCSVTGARDAHRVCDGLGIPHHTLNLREAFARDVVTPFVDDYAAGRTPNPCIACNDLVKFRELMRRVMLQDAEFLATGHYARVERDEAGAPWLARGADPAKDQSYFLYRMTQEQLERTLFPVGGLTKPDVRAIAAEIGLPTADAPESQEVCFVPRDDHGAFVIAARPTAGEPGPIVDGAGRVLGTHRGIARYTVGQRHGLGIASPEALYVLRVDAAANTVVVGPESRLAVREVVCDDVVWRAGPAENVDAQVRYRARPVSAAALADAGSLRVTFSEALTGVAPGQACVCYKGGRVVGGGVIREAR